MPEHSPCMHPGECNLSNPWLSENGGCQCLMMNRDCTGACACALFCFKRQQFSGGCKCSVSAAVLAVASNSFAADIMLDTMPSSNFKNQGCLEGTTGSAGACPCFKNKKECDMELCQCSCMSKKSILSLGDASELPQCVNTIPPI